MFSNSIIYHSSPVGRKLLRSDRSPRESGSERRGISESRRLTLWRYCNNLTEMVRNAIIVRVLIYWETTVLHYHDEGEN